MRKESLNGLSELTGLDRRTIKRKIAHLPFEVEGKSHLYQTEAALPVIYAHEGGAYDTDTERARLLHHQANIAALDEEVKKKNLIPFDVVVTRWQEITATVRAKLLGLPPQLAATCAQSSKDEVEKESKRLVYQALNELVDEIDY